MGLGLRKAEALLWGLRRRGEASGGLGRREVETSARWRGRWRQLKSTAARLSGCTECRGREARRLLRRCGKASARGWVGRREAESPARWLLRGKLEAWWASRRLRQLKARCRTGWGKPRSNSRMGGLRGQLKATHRRRSGCRKSAARPNRESSRGTGRRKAGCRRSGGKAIASRSRARCFWQTQATALLFRGLWLTRRRQRELVGHQRRWRSSLRVEAAAHLIRRRNSPLWRAKIQAWRSLRRRWEGKSSIR